MSEVRRVAETEVVTHGGYHLVLGVPQIPLIASNFLRVLDGNEVVK